MAKSCPESWRDSLAPVLTSAEGLRLQDWLRGQEQSGVTIHPPHSERLRAFALTPLNEVKVVILGQDPYHGPGQANGLAFSVAEGAKVPPSLRNIHRELESDLGIVPPSHGMLEGWARSGVLLLNASLSVEEGRAGSHAGRGWEAITDAALSALARRDVPTAFILWGSHAQARAAGVADLRDAIAEGRHCAITSPHPSPLSAYRGFFGSRPFSRTNAFLESSGRGPVDWRL
ncbi:uracil-DNA glycosylase [Altererythrobacter sp. SALINAS58]|nr:uracil-DNA glycosylase [Alteripontixanthobacter muriae]